MHNPLALLSKDILDAIIAEGHTYFVRQSYSRGVDHFDSRIEGVFLFTHYKDRETAETHLAQLNDIHARVYDIADDTQKQNLYIAAGQPAGYQIYAAILKSQQWEPSPQLGPKIRQYIRYNTSWKPAKGETVRVELYLSFGELYVRLRSGAAKIEASLSEIERN